MDPTTNKYMSSKEIAKLRLDLMKKDTVSNSYDASDKRIPNPTPADNNKCWEGNHNILSSKGD